MFCPWQPRRDAISGQSMSQGVEVYVGRFFQAIRGVKFNDPKGVKLNDP
jgi:hypothetical protein